MNKQSVSRFVKRKTPCSTRTHKTQTQVLLVLMGGLQSEALVVMVADPCPLLNKQAGVSDLWK